MKEKIISFLIAILILLPITVRAEGETNDITGPEMSSPGAIITYTISIQSPSATVVQYDGSVTYETSVLELVSIQSEDPWEGNNVIASSPLDLRFTNSGIVATSSKVAVITFRVKDDVTKSDTIISLSGKLKDRDGNVLPTGEPVSKSISIKSTDNSLKDLKVNGNTVVNFSPSTYSYSMQVEQETTTVNIEATTNSSTASFVEKYGPRSIGLDYGENKIEIKVLSASGEEITYQVFITRLDNRGTNNDLKEIVINSGKVKIPFDKNTLSYNIRTYKETSVNIVATPVDSKATVKIEKENNLQIGDNVVKIIVVSEDGKEKTYTININNLDRDVDTSLKNLEISGLDEEFKFDKNTTDYEIIYKVKYKDKLVFIPTINNDADDVQIDKPLLENTLANLKEGSEVKIRVYATNGAESLYTVTFVADKRINFFFLLSVVVFIILLIIFIRLIINRKKSNPEEPEHLVESEEELAKTKRINKINLE